VRVLGIAGCLLLLVSACAVAQQDGSNSPASEAKGNQTSATANLPDAPSATATVAPKAEGPEKRKRLMATDPYVPLSDHQKFVRWVHYTYSPFTFTSVLFSATWAQMVGDWPSYGGGMQGFGKRLGATLANTETAGFFKVFLLPTLLNDDPRYFYSGKKGVIARGWYAASRVLVTRKDDGRSAFNLPEIVGTLFTAAVTNAYYPETDRGFGATMSRTFGGVTSDAGSNVLREFWPDISRLFHKHEPGRMKKIEEKIPKRVSETMSGEAAQQ
jgi:hypothetical protein